MKRLLVVSAMAGMVTLFTFSDALASGWPWFLPPPPPLPTVRVEPPSVSFGFHYGDRHDGRRHVRRYGYADSYGYASRPYYGYRDRGYGGSYRGGWYGCRDHRHFDRHCRHCNDHRWDRDRDDRRYGHERGWDD